MYMTTAEKRKNRGEFGRNYFKRVNFLYIYI